MPVFSSFSTLLPNKVFEIPVFIIIVGMLIGYNTNISYKGTVYHVQTEDSGLKNLHIITLLYDKGTILSRKKVSYAGIAEAIDYKERVQELMKEQHKAMIKELIAGKHTRDAATAQPLPVLTAEADLHPPRASADPALGQSSSRPRAEEQPAKSEADKKQITRSLDDILLDYIMKEENK